MLVVVCGLQLVRVAACCWLLPAGRLLLGCAVVDAGWLVVVVGCVFRAPFWRPWVLLAIVVIVVVVVLAGRLFGVWSLAQQVTDKQTNAPYQSNQLK